MAWSTSVQRPDRQAQAQFLKLDARLSGFRAFSKLKKAQIAFDGSDPIHHLVTTLLGAGRMAQCSLASSEAGQVALTALAQQLPDVAWLTPWVHPVLEFLSARPAQSARVEVERAGFATFSGMA